MSITNTVQKTIGGGTLELITYDSEEGELEPRYSLRAIDDTKKVIVELSTPIISPEGYKRLFDKIKLSSQLHGLYRSLDCIERLDFPDDL